MKLIYDVSNKPINLRNHFHNASCFLLCTGPSINDIDLSLLDRRGLLIAGINNIAVKHYRPHIWFAVDNCVKFGSNILLDPAIIKFIPQNNLHDKLSTRDEKERAIFSLKQVKTCPNVYTFRKNALFQADKYLYEESVNWGNKTNTKDKQGQKGGRSVFYAAIKILYYLGVKRLYLLGCDFNMQTEEPYAFTQDKKKGACRTNNAQYEMMNIRFRALKPYLDKEGMIIQNCTPDSGFVVFNYIPYEKAIEEALEFFPRNCKPDNLYDLIDNTDK